MSLLSPKNFPLLIALALSAAPVAAAEYSAAAIVDTETYYDGNLGLRARNCNAQRPAGRPVRVCPIEEVEAYRLAPRLRLNARGAVWQAALNTVLRFTRVSNDLYSSDDQIAVLSASRFSEKQRLSLGAEARRESTRTEALELDGLLAATRTEQKSLRPSWTRILNEKNSLTVGANWLEREYRDPGLNDYEQYGVDASWNRQLNERLSLQIGAYKSQFETGAAPAPFFDPALPRLSSETIGLTAGLTRQFNEYLSGSVTLGSRRVDTSTRTVFFIFPITNSVESRGSTAAADLSYTGEAWNGSIRLSRSLNPNGLLGELIESDRASVTYSRQLRQALFFDFSLDVFADESLSGSNVYTRDAWTALPAVRWQFRERWSLTTTIRHRIRESLRGGRIRESDGTAIIFNVRYAHPRAKWSR